MGSTYDFRSRDLDIGTNKLICSLFDDEHTTCIFTSALGDIQSQNELVFKPFRRQTQFIYHEYEIYCSLTRDIEEDVVDSMKRLIVQKAQKIYNCCFTNSPYKFTFKETEVSISQKRKGLHENDDASTLPTCPQIQHSINASQAQLGHDEGSPVSIISQTQHGYHEEQERPSTKKPKTAHDQTLKDIQESYQRAYKDGSLRKVPCTDGYPLPVLGTCWDYNKTWSPYVLTSGRRHDLTLDDKKLQQVKKIRTAVENVIPEADEWDIKAKAQGLGCEDMQEILKFIKRSEYSENVDTGDVLFQVANSDDQASQLIQLGNAWVQNADKVLETGKLFRRVAMIRQLIGYSFYRVAEFLRKGKKQCAENINKEALKVFGSHKRRQREQRDAASLWCWAMAILPGWKGRELALYLQIESKMNILQRCNKRSIPALAGEFVAALEAKGQRYDNSSSLEIPGVNIDFATLANGMNRSHAYTPEYISDGDLEYHDRGHNSYNNSLSDPNTLQPYSFEHVGWFADMGPPQNEWNWEIFDEHLRQLNQSAHPVQSAVVF
ncbi:hypothetical protein BCON_0431g00050 [Botryotinia convoluta]|uniref:Uncharacterized protein n=1 Tax=Botryotinia convoluta TaxID=54673 RepID=A0A4Z1HJ41_9HELO|nr:hypothetical protein BCON_0431g00050 [Botryotinia convoluta]